MTKEQQDLAWACLPKEARNQKISTYFCKRDSDTEYNKGYVDAILHIYGHHNLTSDTEPEEMLMVRRKSIQTVYRDKIREKGHHTTTQSKKDMATGWLNAMRCFFSKDKCLPDKLNDDIGCYMENQLEPYTEPETKDDTKNETKDPVSQNPDKNYNNENHNSNSDNMQAKELNLCELLKGCVGETFYSRAYGEVTLNEIVRDDRPNSQEIKVYTSDPQSDRIWFLRNGRKHKNGEIDLYPSRALYEEYPLDAYSAWMEWQESRKPKYILAVKISSWYDGDDGREDEEYGDNEWFRFKTEEEARQAAEAVRETLYKFHEKTIHQ